MPCAIFLSFITFTTSLFSIIHTNDLTLAMKIEMNKIVSCWYDVAVFINDFIMDIRQIFTVCSDNMFFLGETNSSRFSCCCYTVTRNLFTIFITSNSSQGAWFIFHQPLKIQFTWFISLVIRAPIFSCFLNKFFLTKGLVVQQ